MKKTLGATSPLCGGIDRHCRQTSCPCHLDLTRLGNAPPDGPKPPSAISSLSLTSIETNSSSLPTASYHLGSSNLTPPSTQELHAYFRTRLGPDHIRHAVRAVEGLWSNCQRTLAPANFNFDFVGKLYLDYFVEQKMRSSRLGMEPGQKRQDVALKKTWEDLGLPENEVRSDFRKRRIYMSLLKMKGPGFILLLGRNVAATWEKFLRKNDVLLVLEYQEKFLPMLSTKAAELNPYAAQRIIDFMVEKGWSYKPGIRSTLLDCLSKYVILPHTGQDTSDGIRNKRHLDQDEDISAKHICSTQETPAELDTFMQSAQMSEVTGQAFKDTAEELQPYEMMRPAKFEAQYQVPFDGMQMMQTFDLQDISTIMQQAGGVVTTEGMETFDLQDISTIMQQAEGMETFDMEDISTIMQPVETFEGLPVGMPSSTHPLEMSSGEQPQRFHSAGPPPTTQALRNLGHSGSLCMDGTYSPNVEGHQVFILNSKNMQDAFPQPSDLKLELPAK